MIWQDILLSFVMVLFSYALIPQVYYTWKTKKSTIVKQTSLINSVGMFTIVVVYLTLNLTFSTLIALITATLGLILFIQGITYS